jgi:hypothetical protein
VVPRPDGSRYETSFYECAGCSVVFIDPNAFNANEPGSPKSAGAKLPVPSPSMTLETYSKAGDTTPQPSSRLVHIKRPDDA